MHKRQRAKVLGDVLLNSYSRTLQIYLVLSPTLRLGDHNLRQAIRPLLCLDSDLAICTEDVNWLKDIIVNVPHQLLDRFAVDVPILRREGLKVGSGQSSYPQVSLTLLPRAGTAY